MCRSWFPNFKTLSKCKKPDAKAYLVHDSVYVKCPEMANVETESRLVVAWGWEWEWKLTADRHVGSFWGDGNGLKLDCGDECTTL